MADIQDVIQELRDGLGKARAAVKGYEDFMEKVNEGALRKATLVSTVGRTLPTGKQILIHMGGEAGPMAIPVSPKLAFDELKPGLTMWVSKEGIAIGATTPEPGIESKVVSVDEHGAIVSYNGTPKLLPSAPGVLEQLSVGDLVHLDAFGVVVLAKLPKKTTYSVQAENVDWADIGGLEEAKRDMVEVVEMPLTHKDLFTRFNKKPTKGVLLYGPPGCGKTMLGKAASTSVAKLFGNTKTPGFFYIKGPEVLSKWVGESESNVRALFDKAREFKKNTGSPAVIFIDEAESLLSSRTNSTHRVDLGVITTFLAEMDGLDDSGAMVLLSTNRPDSLDSAITRDGRIDKKVHVHRPSKKDTGDIFSKYLKKIPTAGGAHTPEELGEELFNDKFSFYNVTMKDGEVRKFGLKDIVSGAMVAGIVESAISIAMRREIETKTRQEGVCKEDLLSAIAKTFHQNKDVRLKEDLEAFTEPFKDKVASVQKCTN